MGSSCSTKVKVIPLSSLTKYRIGLSPRKIQKRSKRWLKKSQEDFLLFIHTSERSELKRFDINTFQHKHLLMPKVLPLSASTFQINRRLYASGGATT